MSCETNMETRTTTTHQMLRHHLVEQLWVMEPLPLPPSTYRQKLLGLVPTIIDAPVHADEASHVRLVLDAGVVQAGVQHD